MTAILQVRDLVKRFAGLVATDHVTLDVTEGHIHALIGPNGRASPHSSTSFAVS